MSTSARLNIPLSFNQIIDLIKQLPKTQQEKLVSLIQEQDDFDVPEWHKEIVRERMKTASPESFKPWSKVKKQLKHKK
jgi:hypothetical protein